MLISEVYITDYACKRTNLSFVFLTHPSLMKVEALYQFEGYPRWHVEMSPCGTSLGQTVLFKVTPTLFLVRVIGMTLNHSKPFNSHE